MRIAMMGRSNRGRMAGAIRYTRELVAALAEQGQEIVVFVKRSDHGLEGLPVRTIRSPFPVEREYSRALWEQAVVPFEVSRLKPDVYHSPYYTLPLGLRCPTVVTIHDMGFVDPSLHRRRDRLVLSPLTTAAVRKADRVICVSEHTRSALVERHPEVAERARVVTEGVSPRFQAQPPEVVERFRVRHGLPERYLLFVGTIEPRKNVARLVEAYEIAVQRHDLPDHLVLIGRSGWMNDDAFARIERSTLRERIHVIGYLDDDDLPAAYAGCTLFVYPSIAEGFGLPPIEAMACGAPVVTSNTTALPSTVGDAAITVDPFDVDAIAGGIGDVLTDRDLRERLVEAGYRRAAELSWQAVAERTIDVYREIAG